MIARFASPLSYACRLVLWRADTPFKLHELFLNRQPRRDKISKGTLWRKRPQVLHGSLQFVQGGSFFDAVGRCPQNTRA
jgi:hypothetical protein